ncbi:hypothetical protein [Atopobium fossor]|uniref:hypothetical protein n=1 Tax=Atopobium fossor TaxID=39487 RepID=UPI0012EC0123|nr:hypothetical protein [Atopobium fossor]
MLRQGYAQGHSYKSDYWKQALPRHTPNSISRKAYLCGLTTGKRKKWNAAENAFIHNNLRTLAHELRVSKSQLLGHIASMYQKESKRK